MIFLFTCKFFYLKQYFVSLFSTLAIFADSDCSAYDASDNSSNSHTYGFVSILFH